MSIIAMLGEDQRFNASTGGLTVHDALEIAADVEGFRIELHEGALRMAPPPDPEHQKIEFRLERHFEHLHRLAFHQIGIRFGDHSFRTPDVAVLRPGATVTVDPLQSPDLFEILVEIVSPTSRDEDRLIKPKLYARAGIPEYWRVEPDNHDYVVHMARLQADRYTPTRVTALNDLLQPPR